jgi:hypothetical protein
MRIKKMKKLLVFLFMGLVLFVTTSFADSNSIRTNTTKLEALESDPAKRPKFNSLSIRYRIAFIESELAKIAKNPTENSRIADLNKEKEDCIILLNVHSLGEDMCREVRKLALRSELNESNVDYYPTYEYLCFFRNE